MGMGGFNGSIFRAIQAGQNPGTATGDMEAERLAQGITPLGQNPTRTQGVYAPPTQTSDYANPIPQYQPSRFDFNPYAAAYQQQFGQNMPSAQAPQAPQQASGLGALAQLYGMYNAAPQTADAQSTHASSLAAAANTPI